MSGEIQQRITIVMYHGSMTMFPKPKFSLRSDPPPPTDPCPKKARISWSNAKTLLCSFLRLQEYAPPGQTVNKEYYRGLLRCFRDAVHRKRNRIAYARCIATSPGHCTCLSAQLIRQIWANHNILHCRPPPYSSDLAYCDFFFFSKIKFRLTGTLFRNVQEMRRGSCSLSPERSSNASINGNDDG